MKREKEITNKLKVTNKTWEIANKEPLLTLCNIQIGKFCTTSEQLSKHFSKIDQEITNLQNPFTKIMI